MSYIVSKRGTRCLQGQESRTLFPDKLHTLGGKGSSLLEKKKPVFSAKQRGSFRTKRERKGDHPLSLVTTEGRKDVFSSRENSSAQRFRRKKKKKAGGGEPE